MNTRALELTAARLTLGFVLSDELPDIALSALEEGYDSPSLRVLAGMTAAETSEAQALFGRVLAELNIPAPTTHEAVMLLSLDTADGILRGTVAPYEGAKSIWKFSLCLQIDRLTELEPFLYAASEWEERPEDRKLFEDAIVNEARRLLATQSE